MATFIALLLVANIVAFVQADQCSSVETRNEQLYVECDITGPKVPTIYATIKSDFCPSQGNLLIDNNIYPRAFYENSDKTRLSTNEYKIETHVDLYYIDQYGHSPFAHYISVLQTVLIEWVPASHNYNIVQASITTIDVHGMERTWFPITDGVLDKV